MVKALLNLFGFLSILPTGMADELEDVARRMYLFPLAGAFLGLVAGAVVHITSLVFPLTISSTLGFFFLLALTGLHHLDGLLDFGDALIFRGSKERRKDIMHDTTTGVGGFVAGLFVVGVGILATYEYVSSGGSPIVLFLTSESLAKLAMVFGARFGTAAFEGMGSVFTTAVRSNWHVVLASVITGIIIVPVLGWIALILLLVPFISSLVFVWVSRALIGGMSGDVFGTINESSRILCMLVMVWML